MNRVWALTLNTCRETVRDRVLYAFVFFAVALTFAGILLGSLSEGQSIRVIEDIGLFAISTIGGVIAIFVGTNLVYKELDKRTIYLIFTKPISRWEFILGKFLGLSLCILIMIGLMSAFLLGITLLTAGNARADVISTLPAMLIAIGSVYLELLLVVAMATFFSTFATPLMSFIFTLGLWAAGHMSASMLALSKQSNNPGIEPLCKAIYLALPDLAKLTEIRFELITPTALGTSHLSFFHANQEVFMLLTCYVLVYVLMLLSLGTLIIERREFN